MGPRAVAGMCTGSWELGKSDISLSRGKLECVLILTMSASGFIVDIPEPGDEPLSAPLSPSFDYTRSTGAVLGRFLTGLRDGRLLGVRDSAGVVHLPPVEFDPVTRESLAAVEPVEVDPVGTLQTWTWDAARGDALALVRFDGADTAMFVRLECAREVPASGLRVRVAWHAERNGSVTDLHCVPGEQAEPAPAVAADGEVTGIVTPVQLHYTHTAGFAERRFLRGLKEGRFVGRRRSNGPEVYVPPRDYCPADGVPMGEYVDVADTGTVTTFGIVNVPFAGQKITPPYVTAYILLDGADLPIQHLVLGSEASAVRMGMRVRAVWRPAEERSYSMASITHFEPTGEPDAARKTYDKHL